jgi:TatD DNase family protein
MTNSPGVYLSCKTLYTETKYLKFALGFHPLEAKLNDRDFSDFLSLSTNANYIGEVGLDFSGSISISKEKQLIYFNKIVNMCALKNKLLSVHLRKSEDEAIEIIGKNRPKKCIIHWFTGTIEQKNKLIELGCYFSINLNMVRTAAGCNKLKSIPKNRMLIESDGPFTKVGSQKFSPEILTGAYEAISNSISEPNLAELVYANFREILER